ncbi:MAG: endonuclease I [Bdellovibrionales bacterium GWC1_52_8]|nr:MAG: endonuclease I [Bdellovibrionales bacterium GWB1_52_6]OFZ04936.1 MAG: endonuclease I [Bdellovibrionales bacterium GWA1_52_35]OFZ40441.1 MAG: endonuclease I [Bdellovibrionales bacterium GWC1_52_8]
MYCPCRYSGRKVDLASCGYKPRKNFERAQRLEWEHVVPAEAFGQSFKEWREGAPGCFKKKKAFRGRKCAGKNPEFAQMEADLYNLWPSIGELNGLRSNFSMAELGTAVSEQGGKTFGGCGAKILDKKFEPEDEFKGIVARTYLYMEQEYPGRGVVSNKNRKLFEAWDKLHPVAQWECQRAKLIEKAQGSTNRVLSDRCRKAKL